MKISVISPVKNEVDFIGYSAMAVLPYVHEILYGVATSDDGTLELVDHLYRKGDGKIKYWHAGNVWNFDPMDLKAYNDSYNALIKEATGDVVWFLHPDMVVTNPEAIAELAEGPLAWFTHINSFANNLNTEIVAGRTKRWKNIHAKQFGLHYFGGYGSVNEDFYHRDITGTAYRHHGDDFAEYPFEVADSGIKINHYCELKSFKRRFEKMKRCLKTQNPHVGDKRIEELALNHPRVTLEETNVQFGQFRFAPTKTPLPAVFEQYADEFGQFKKETVHV